MLYPCIYLVDLIVFITVMFISRNKQTNAYIGSSDRISRLEQWLNPNDKITLSGFSSGGTFAQQLQISYSSIFNGIAVLSHGYYRCGPGDGIARNYDDVCTIITNSPRDRLYNPDYAIQDIWKYFDMGLIEDPNNLFNKKLYIYIGTLNWIHSPDFSLRIVNVYEPFIKNPNAIFVRAQPVNLTLPTNHFGGTCSQSSPQNFYLSNCGFSVPFDALQFILGPEIIKFDPKGNIRIPLQPLQLFDQTEFSAKIKGDHWMDSEGFLYVPEFCKKRYGHRCPVHFYFHGCGSGREKFGRNHVLNSGFLEIAELNRVIMVFPQILSNTGENRFGCWDTYGFTSKLYATQQGKQVTAVRNMLSRILGH